MNDWTLQDGEALRLRRFAAGVTQQALADAARLMVSDIYALENALRAPFRNELKSILKALRRMEETKVGLHPFT